MSPALERMARGSARRATIALRHDDAIPHKWGCDAEAGASVGAIAAGKGAEAQKIGLGKLARPVVRPHIDGASLRIACGRDARPSDAGRALVTQSRGASLPPVLLSAGRDGRHTPARDCKPMTEFQRG